MQLDCPFCQQPAMTALRKLALGFSSNTICRHCGLRVTVAPGRALIAMLPSLILIAWVVIAQPREPVSTISLGIMAFAMTCILHLFYTPLIRNQLDPKPFLRILEAQQQRAAEDKPDSADHS